MHLLNLLARPHFLHFTHFNSENAKNACQAYFGLKKVNPRSADEYGAPRRLEIRVHHLSAVLYVKMHV